jgi:hypothetical protein
VKIRFPKGVVALSLGVVACSQHLGQVGLAAAPAGRAFLVFDALKDKGKPDAENLGMLPAVGISEASIGLQGNSMAVDSGRLDRRLSGLRDFRGLIYIDIEKWPLCDASPETLAVNIQRYIDVAEMAHRIAPATRIGFYSTVPQRQYFPIIRSDTLSLARWRECNRKLAPIASSVAVVLPSLYTFYNSPDGWEKYAVAMIREARRYGKPVYAFLWPEFFDGTADLAGRPLPAEFWRRELETCRREADGIVIWSKSGRQWNEKAPWWVETRRFLAELR